MENWLKQKQLGKVQKIRGINDPVLKEKFPKLEKEPSLKAPKSKFNRISDMLYGNNWNKNAKIK
jgi:hypothetical protein